MQHLSYFKLDDTPKKHMYSQIPANLIFLAVYHNVPRTLFN